MLDETVVSAVSAGTFHIWGVRTIDEGIELLTGMPAGELDEAGEYPKQTIHHLVKKRLHTLAQELKQFGGDDNDDEEEE